MPRKQKLTIDNNGQGEHLIFTVPGTPPSGNHYKKPNFRTHHTYVTSEAEKFWFDMGVLVAGRKVDGKRFSVRIDIFLGKKQKGDIDNFAKVVLDGLTKSGVFKSDAAVDELMMNKYRDIENPRTVVWVKRIR